MKISNDTYLYVMTADDITLFSCQQPAHIPVKGDVISIEVTNKSPLTWDVKNVEMNDYRVVRVDVTCRTLYSGNEVSTSCDVVVIVERVEQ